MYSLKDIGAVFTSCLFPEFVVRAVDSMRYFYPEMSLVIVHDNPENREEAAATFEAPDGVEILYNRERVGAGRAIDRGLRMLSTRLFLTVDHGVELVKAGLVEAYLSLLNENERNFCAGMLRDDKRCNRAFGPYVDPLFALWDREFIAGQADPYDPQGILSFKLTHIRIGDWQVDGCSTAQYLQYRALRLGRTQAFITRDELRQYLRHYRTPKDRGRCASPHELADVPLGYLSDRLRNLDGSLAYKGERV